MSARSTVAATSPPGTAGTVQRGTSRRGPGAKSVSPMLDRLKQVRAGVLDVGHVEVGPGHGQAVLLLHGWPYDIHSFEEVAPALADAGYRVVVPYLRGYGTTRFLSDDTNRNGQQAALAVDAIALMNALGMT